MPALLRPGKAWYKVTRFRQYGPFALVVLITFFRVAMLALDGRNLYADEAQYWDWSRQLEWGYYSKPPMVAWLIALTTHYCGQTEFCIRLGSPILHGFTSLLIFFSARVLYNQKVAIWAMLAYATLPAVSFSAQLISTDPLLLFFWSLSLYFFIRAIEEDQLRWWLLAGMAAGGGMLSKYSMVMFLPSAILFLILTPAYRPLLRSRGFWLAMLLALLVYAPNIFWNYQHGFASYHHTQEISQLNRVWFHPFKLLAFLGAQAGMFGPVLFGVLVVSLWPGKLRDEGNNAWLLRCFILPLLLLITLLSFFAKAEANWAAPVYSTAVILVVAAAFHWQKPWLVYGSVGLHMLLLLVSSLYSPLYDSYAWDPGYRLRGWRALGEAVEQRARLYPGAYLLFDDRKTMAEMLYYGKTTAEGAQKWNQNGRTEDHYDLTRDIQASSRGGNYLFISKLGTIAEMPGRFRHISRLDDIHIPVYADYALHYRVYYLEGFKGYE